MLKLIFLAVFVLAGPIKARAGGWWDAEPLKTVCPSANDPALTIYVKGSNSDLYQFSWADGHNSGDYIRDGELGCPIFSQNSFAAIHGTGQGSGLYGKRDVYEIYGYTSDHTLMVARPSDEPDGDVSIKVLSPGVFQVIGRHSKALCFTGSDWLQSSADVNHCDPKHHAQMISLRNAYDNRVQVTRPESYDP